MYDMFSFCCFFENMCRLNILRMYGVVRNGWWMFIGLRVDVVPCRLWCFDIDRLMCACF